MAAGAAYRAPESALIERRSVLSFRDERFENRSVRRSPNAQHSRSGARGERAVRARRTGHRRGLSQSFADGGCRSRFADPVGTRQRDVTAISA